MMQLDLLQAEDPKLISKLSLFPFHPKSSF